MSEKAIDRRYLSERVETSFGVMMFSLAWRGMAWHPLRRGGTDRLKIQGMLSLSYETYNRDTLQQHTRASDLMI